MAKAIVMVGGPGSGKSYVADRDYENVQRLDADSIKAEHPDYDPKNPAVLHAWSAQELTRRLYATLGRNEDFVLDGTGTSVERYVKQMADMRQAGYEIELVYVRTSLRTALQRNASRERVVPEDVVREKHAIVATSFEILSGYADSVRVVNND